MKEVVLLSKPDIYTKNFVNQLGSLSEEINLTIQENPDEFINNLSKADYDLIVVDFSLKEADGTDIESLVRTIREMNATVPVVVLSLLHEYDLVGALESVANVHFMLKLNDNKDALRKLLLEKKTPVSQPSAPKPKSKYKILVVDDFENTRFVVKFSLEKEGYLVVTAADGLEALQKLRQEPDIDLLIVDLNMPRMDGLQLIEEIRKEQILKDKPIIILTTEIDNKKREKAKQLKITGWIQKPYKLTEFLEIIRRTLKQ